MAPRGTRELRVGFAMGGGVSLGDFSGAALAEAIKLLILYGGYTDPDGNFKRYSRVVVDVFSGASAGGMSLGLMLRKLVHRTAEEEAGAESALLADPTYGPDAAAMKRDEPGLFADLVAAQVVQDVQNRTWCNDVNLDLLLGRFRGTQIDLRHEPSLLWRGAVDNIAKGALGFAPGELIDPAGIRLLAPRVLYECTLSNMTPLIADARDEFGSSEFEKVALYDGLTSPVHRDARVFDLNFRKLGKARAGDPDPFPRRWVRFHMGDPIPPADADSGEVMDLRAADQKPWAMIAATAIACGAFPAAFGPVVLRRRRHEYGPRLWPALLKDADSHLFTFVDGGAFNNEPIRDAFRLASFADSQYTDGNKVRSWNFDRRIIFVDPAVASPPASLGVPGHREFKLDEPNIFGTFDGSDTERRVTFDRLLSHAGTLIGAILGEARGVEGDKIRQVRNCFDLRDSINKAIREQATDPEKQEIKAYLAFVDLLRKTAKDESTLSMFPSGAITEIDELCRVIGTEEELWPLAKVDGKDDVVAAVTAFLADIDAGRKPPKATAGLWSRALAFAATDIAMGLAGKWKDARLIGLCPIKSKPAVPGAFEYLRLPGDPIAAFSGFAGINNKPFEVAAARWSARQFLGHAGGTTLGDPILDPSAPTPVEPEWTDRDAKEFAGAIERCIDELSERVRQVVKDSSIVSVFPGLDGAIQSFVAKAVRNKMKSGLKEGPRRVRCEVRVNVPDANLELDDPGFGDQDISPVRSGPGGTFQLITFLDYFPQTDGHSRTWVGPYLQEAGTAQAHFRVDRPGFSAGFFAKIPTPNGALVDSSELWPNPILVVDLKAADKGKVLQPGRWRVEPGVAALDESLFG